MPRIGILDQLTDAQQAQLLTWLETMSLTEVLQMLNAQPPEGFGIRTLHDLTAPVSGAHQSGTTR